MATETLYPDGTVFTTVGFTTPAVSDVDGVEDGTWLTSDGANTQTVAASLPTPSGDLNTGAGLQTYRVWGKKSASGGGTPTLVISVRETGDVVDLATGSTESVTSATGEEFLFTWDASVLNDGLDGAAVEVFITMSKDGGGDNERNVDIDSIGFITDHSAGGPGTVTPSGVAVTGAVGTPTIDAEANVSVSGVAVTAALSPVSVALPRVVQVSGLAATGESGSVSIVAEANVFPTGLGATGFVGVAIGTPSWSWDAGHFTLDAGNHKYDGWHVESGAGAVTVIPTGVEVTGAIGTPTIEAKANVSPTGVEVTGAIGVPVISLPRVVVVAGLAATGAVGTPAIKADANVLAGVAPKFTDTFTDTDTTLLTAHTPDLGIDWVKVGGGGDPEIISNRVEAALSAHLIPATFANCVITADFFTTDETNSNAAIIFRSLSRTDLNNYWQLTSSDGSFILTTDEGGSQTFTDTNSSLGSNNNVTRSIEITLHGNSVKVKVDGNTLWDLTDSANQSGAFHGIRFTGFGDESWVDNFGVVCIGIEATGAVESVTVIAESPVTVIPTGVAATGELGTVSIEGKANVFPAGLEATGAIEPVSIAVHKTVIPTGVEVTGAIEPVAVEAKANVFPVGVEATGEVEPVSVAVHKTVIPAGLEATGEVGTPTIEAQAIIQVTGLEATGQIGTPAIEGKANVFPTGVEATGEVEPVTISLPRVVVVSGLTATGGVGLIAVEAKANVFPAGVEATGEVEPVTVVIAGDVTVIVSGLEATGEVGTPAIDAEANVFPAGVESTGEVGSPVISLPKVVAVTGLEATGELGSPTIDAEANVFPTGVEATGEVEPVTVIIAGDVVVIVNGVEVTGAVGSPTIDAEANVFPAGVEATGEVEPVSIALPRVVVVSGVEASGEVGDPAISAEAIIQVTGLEATGEIGSPAIDAEANVFPTGVESTAEVGAPTVSISVTIQVTGVEAVGQIGAVGVKGDANTIPAGVSADGQVGSVTVITEASVVVPVTGVEAVGEVGSVTVSIVDCTWEGTAEILVAAFDRLDAFVYSPQPVVLWPGLHNAPPAAGMWLEPNLMPGETINIVWDDCATVDTNGFLQIMVYYRPDQGQLDPSELADALIDHFPKGLELGPVGVNERPWQLPAVTDDASKLFIPVMVPYLGLT